MIEHMANQGTVFVSAKMPCGDIKRGSFKESGFGFFMSVEQRDNFKAKFFVACASFIKKSRDFGGVKRERFVKQMINLCPTVRIHNQAKYRLLGNVLIGFISLPVQFSKQPSFGLVPFAYDGDFGDAEHFSSF